MKNRLHFLLIPLLLLIFASCDGGGGDNQCTELISNNNYLLVFAGCPNDGIKSVCNSFECELTSQIGGAPAPPDALIIVDPVDCSRLDRCFNLECDLRNEMGEITGEVILTTFEILFGNAFEGTAVLNSSGQFNFTCNVILP